MKESKLVSFRPATVPASFTTTMLVCEVVPAVINCTIVGIKAARKTIARRITVVMMKLRAFTRFLYSRTIIKPILRRLFWAAAPELTATASFSKLKERKMEHLARRQHQLFR